MIASNLLSTGGEYMIKVAICDDMPKMTTAIEQSLLNFDADLFDIAIFFDPSKLIATIKENHYDLFILDIEMPTHSGIELATEIRKIDLSVPIIFLTSFSEYMEEVFKVQTFDYILKPITDEKIFPVLKKVIRYLDIADNDFSFTYNRVVYNLKFSDIIYFEKQKRSVIIHTKHSIYQLNISTPDLLAKLNNDFVQVHTSYIVNTRFIKEIGNSYLILKEDSSSTEIPISRKFKNTARDEILMKLRSKI